jgi:hypothetical protein
MPFGRYKLLPLLESSEKTSVQEAAAQALAVIPPGDRANEVIDKLLSIREDSYCGFSRLNVSDVSS